VFLRAICHVAALANGITTRVIHPTLHLIPQKPIAGSTEFIGGSLGFDHSKLLGRDLGKALIAWTGKLSKVA
jgi:hypothetical protein